MKKKILILLIASLLVTNPIKADAKEMTSEYQTYIESVCETYSLCPELVEAIIFYESSWETDVVSSAGCIGLMQVHPKVHKKRMDALGVTDLSNAYQNILVGCDLLADLFEQYGEATKVLDAYAGTLKSDSYYEAGYMSKYSQLVLNYSADLEREHDK